MFNKIGKKGELTTQQIVLLIILIASFAVVLYFFMSMNFGEESEKEVCHNSVVMASHSSLSGDTELNCERTYLCITEDGTCEGFSNPKKAEVDNLEEVYETLSTEMAECWWMYGEGRLNYVGDKALKKNYCSICSQVLFDDSLNNLEGVEEGKIDLDDFYEYMSEKSLSSKEVEEDSETYLEYILGTNNITQLKEQISSHENYTSEFEPSFGEVETGDQYYVVMGITSEVSGVWEVASVVSMGAGVVSLFIPGVNIFTGAILISGGSATGSLIAENVQPEIAAITIEGKGIDNEFTSPTIVKVESSKFESLNCKEILNKA